MKEHHHIIDLFQASLFLLSYLIEYTSTILQTLPQVKLLVYHLVRCIVDQIKHEQSNNPVEGKHKEELTHASIERFQLDNHNNDKV